MDSFLDQRFFPLIFDAISHGIFTIDADGLITSFNRAAEQMTGYARCEVMGKLCSSILQTELCQTDCPLKSSMHNGQRNEDREVFITTKNSRILPIAICTAALRDEDGSIVGGVEMFHDLRQVAVLRKKIENSYVFDDIVSKNHRIQQIFDTLPLIANSRSTVLIQGDSGTGKELVARAIHNFSPWRKEPFVALNCGAVPDNLIESELFGYKKGAFTDAKKDKPGRFALAEGGTLLLDEVGDLSRQMQVKLLRVLQEREYEPLGSTVTVKANLRIIASTNRDLARDVSRRKFRQDLYYRLNVVHVDLPALRERKEDIPLLVRHFIERFNHMQCRRISSCSERVMLALMRYDFPGNIRELENIIEHAFVVCTNSIIQLDDLPQHILVDESWKRERGKVTIRPLDDAEAQTIRGVLERCSFNRSKACRELGVSRNTLWRKMKKYRIAAPGSQQSES
ncbi:MAG TPA: sigma 54-interacting transcriptional regulator [Myxococcota bacterium]|nr:sigma 54-interacting transcriptional regulator [Myxococcota bacterium]